MQFSTQPGRYDLITADVGDAWFAAMRETVALVHGRPRLAASALAHATVECRRHESVPGTRCAVCPHFLDATPAGDGCSVTVRCLFLESDPVELVMTRAADLERIDAADTVGTALQRLIRERIHELLVVDDEVVVGLADAGALWGRSRAQRLRAALGAPLPVMPRTLSLGSAARALVERGRSCALVVDCERVVGLVTRGDLARVGVPGV